MRESGRKEDLHLSVSERWLVVIAKVRAVKQRELQRTFSEGELGRNS